MRSFGFIEAAKNFGFLVVPGKFRFLSLDLEVGGTMVGGIFPEFLEGLFGFL